MTNRRNILTGGSSLLVVGALAACSKGVNISTITKTIQVTLQNAQNQSVAVFSAVSAFAKEFATTFSTTVQSKINSGLTVLGGAVKAFASLPNGSMSVAQFAQNVINAINSIIPLIPIPGPAQVAITESLTLLSALIAGMSTIAVTTAPTAALVAGKPARYTTMGPIPIPVP